MRARWIVVTILTLAGSGCASVSKEECTRGDWTQIGYRDGATGAVADILAEHDKACAEVGVKTNPAAWREGYSRGVLTYCTPESGFEAGLRNDTYRGVCPRHLEPAFQARYSSGREVYKARRILDQYDRDVSSLNQQLRSKDLKPHQRSDLMRQLNFQRLQRHQAAIQVQTIEAWARGIAVPPPAPLAPTGPLPHVR